MKPGDSAKHEQAVRDLRRIAEQRQQGYRDRALNVLPHICASCGREFVGKRLRELTVHHKDHNWKNNPTDGSNWELLCLFCHDHEHEKYKLVDYHGGARAETAEPGPSIFSPFAGLDQLVTPAPAEPNQPPPADAAATEAKGEPTPGEN